MKPSQHVTAMASPEDSLVGGIEALNLEVLVEVEEKYYWPVCKEMHPILLTLWGTSSYSMVRKMFRR